MRKKIQNMAATLWPVTLFFLIVFVPLEVYRSYRRFKPAGDKR